MCSILLSLFWFKYEIIYKIYFILYPTIEIDPSVYVDTISFLHNVNIFIITSLSIGYLNEKCENEV